MKNYSDTPISLEEAKQKFNNIHRNIKDLLYTLGDDCDNVHYNSEELDEDFMRDQYRWLADKLNDVERRLTYLSKPVRTQGLLTHNQDGRYAFPNGEYLTSGNVCEILYVDKRRSEQYWVFTSIEHHGEDYYATALGKDISINGLFARVR